MTETADLSAFFETASYDRQTFQRFADLVYASAATVEQFAALLSERREGGAAGALRTGVGLLLLGRYREALDALAKAGDSADAHYYAGQAAAALGRWPDAIKSLEQAGRKGMDGLATDMGIAALHVRAGNVDAAEKLISRHERDGASRGEWHRARAQVLEARGSRVEALEHYEKALEIQPDDTPTMFGAALLHDLHGDDDRAIELYELLAEQPRAHVNALINLAVLYEDLGRCREAIACLRRVLALYPQHTPARQFLKDAGSSRQMGVAAAVDRRDESRARLLDTPITEFDLTMRARNCLKKMRINTLGDLVRRTEAELLAYKNFGDTSLQEVKALLAKRGLHLGQPLEEIDPASVVLPEPPPARPDVPPGSEAALSRPVSELEFSVRARRALQRLNIQTVADLIQHSEAELLSIRNFGTTSLSVIRAKLSELGLSLAPKP